jgi:hypothetical protein
MKGSFDELGLDFTGPGFFADSISQDSPKFRANRHASQWLRWQQVFSQARNGNFRETHQLIDIYESGDAGLEGVCYILLAYAGTAKTLRNMMQLVSDRKVDYLAAVDFCEAIAMAGSLSAAPAVLNAFVGMWRKGFSEIEMIPHRLSDQLEAESGPIDEPERIPTIENYQSLVMGRIEELRQRFKTDQVWLFHGELAGVVPLAQLILRSIAKKDFMEMETLRERFEASTGIDCRPFYKKTAFQPLTAAAIVEKFLESPEATKYETGVRYFFGHRIPD